MTPLRHLHRAYLLLHADAVEVGIGTARLFVQAEGYHDVLHTLAQRFLVDAGIGYHAVLEGEERHGPVHRARVNIYISYLLGKVLGHCALAAR